MFADWEFLFFFGPHEPGKSDEPLRRDVLHYIYEQTSNVHQHSEECTAAIMQCLTQLLNASEIRMHFVTTRDLVTHTRNCSDNEAHLVENLSETKSSACFIQQRFEQEGNKLDSIQTQLMQLTDHNEPQLPRASPVAPVVEHSRPPPSTIPRDARPVETEYAEASPRHSRDEEAPCQVGQENAEEIREATPAPNEASATLHYQGLE
ncbi:hypothetical protein FOZ62_025629 [Perkinsus olseni]|uniref:Uncharacterized protein n=1 Tax=Perkinsus olseni TaxID=32597 RepID=A0A7J6RZE5_PEROL|nr:hypothetical protein FOZ62_025629 [Perkinsus olseni]